MHYPLRFGLEVAALAALCWWGAGLDAPLFLRAAAAVVLPAAAAVAWAVFRVPNDPGPAIVAIPGRARLALEGVLFAAAAAAFGSRAGIPAGVVFGGLALADAGLSWRRIARLARG